jgi:hypothetical protein
MVAANRGRLAVTASGRSRHPPWVIITDYPRWPSPYFTHLDRHAHAELRLTFRRGLDGLEGISVPGVINLHRLKRLYHDGGGRTSSAAAAFLDRLASLHGQGWRIVWTVHNLLPIDGQLPGPADYTVTRAVLSLADMVLCHTRADAAALRNRTAADIRVTGWAGLEPSPQPPAPEVAALAARMRSAPVSFLLAGHVTAYKDVPGAITAFLAATHDAHLTVAGACRDSRTAARLAHLAASSGGRVSLWAERFAPEQAGYLYAMAHAAVCPYLADGPFRFFADVLHPSSVGTATGFHVPVIAPALPAVTEITHGQQRWLAPPGTGLGQAMATAEADIHAATRSHGDPRGHRPAADAAIWWRRITCVYRQAADDLRQQRPYPTLQGDPSDA